MLNTILLCNTRINFKENTKYRVILLRSLGFKLRNEKVYLWLKNA